MELIDKYEDEKGATLVNEQGKPVRTASEAARIIAMKSAKPVVSSQQMTPEQWKSELATLYGTDREKIQAALVFRNDERGKGVSDNIILNKIKECL